MTSNHEFQVVIGTGPLGLAIIDELLARGKRVIAVNRNGRAVHAGVEVQRCDCVDGNAVAQVCHGATVVYHCAKPPYNRWPEQFPPLTRGILEGVAKSGAKLVYADNLYMYGPVSGPITETSPVKATSRKGITRAKMAEELLEASRRGRLRVVIGRAPDFYGPRVLESSLGKRVFSATLAGKPAELLGNPDALHTHIYIRDFARGLITLGERSESDGEVWHIPADTTVTTRTLVDMIFNAAKREPKYRVAPKMIVNLLSLWNSDMREIKEMLYQFESPFVVQHDKFQSTFGATVTPHTDAIEETVRWFARYAPPVTV